MSSFQKTKYLARGFIGGAVVTASVCYSFFAKIQSKKLIADDSRPQTIADDSNDGGDLLYHPFGRPVDHRKLIHYSGHSCYYDSSRKQPLWVAQVITKDSLNGNASRRRSKFRRDKQIPDMFASDNSDYWKSGWSRGHMAPAGDFKNSQKAMDDTFYLTNIVPQDLDNNSGFWNRLETHCRELAKSFDKIHIITGPLYHYNKEQGDKRFVEYQVIGKSLVPVPTHLYKVVVAYNDGSSNRKKPSVAAFMVPNKPIDYKEDELTHYEISLDDLASYTGFTFIPELKLEDTANLCQIDDKFCRLKHWKDFELELAYKKLNNARSAADLADIIKSLKHYGIKPTDKLLIAIEQKSQEIETSQPAGQRDYKKG